jgi:hypothetical protein
MSDKMIFPATGPSAPPIAPSTLKMVPELLNHSHGMKSNEITIEISPAFTKFSF